MQKQTKFERFNDGVAYIYREIDRRSNFGAKMNTSALDDLSFITKLSFSEQSKRQQDVEFAQQQGFTLTLKIKTRYIKGVDNKCKAVIDGYLYDVSYVDSTRTELYLYLQGVDHVTGD
jgi:SPP1 family predicted phage head-tail adaptor